MNRKFNVIFFVSIFLIQSFISCKDEVSDASSSNSVSIVSNIFPNTTPNQGDIPDVEIIATALTHAPWDNLVSSKSSFEINGPVKSFELFEINETERLSELLRNDIQTKKNDKKVKFAFNVDGYLTLKVDFKDKSHRTFKFDENNFPLETKTLINESGRSYSYFFNYDAKNRLISMTDDKKALIIEWTYASKDYNPIDIRAYANDALQHQTRLTWENEVLKEIQKLGYAGTLTYNEVVYKELFEYKYLSDGVYSIRSTSKETGGGYDRLQYFNKRDFIISQYNYNIFDETTSKSNYEWDQVGNLQGYEYEAADKQLYNRSLTGPLKLVNKSNYVYDKHNNIIKERSPLPRTPYDSSIYIPSTDNLTTEYKYVYDDFGNWIEKVKILEESVVGFWKREIEYY